MYGIEVVTPASGRAVTAAELRAHLRLNDAAEDGQLEDWLDAAAELFELQTRRPILATVYRQSFRMWPRDGCIVLGRGGVSAVGTVSRKLADGSTASVSGWAADLATAPARVQLGTVPDLIDHADGYTVAPAGSVTFTAGWANAAAVPRAVRSGVKLLAAHYYANREAFSAGRLDELPAGWAAICAPYRLGLSGDWGMG